MQGSILMRAHFDTDTAKYASTYFLKEIFEMLANFVQI